MNARPTEDRVTGADRTEGAFDVIIVGGGSAGAGLARRLSENSARTVLLREAGETYAPDGYPDVIATADRVGGDTQHDWGFEADAGPLGRRLRVPRGRVLGGSSGVNAAVASRARPSDFATWTGQGLEGWSFPEVLETFKALEHTPDGDDQFRGRSGPFPVRNRAQDELTPSLSAFITASAHQGFARTADYNGAAQAGVAPYPLNVVSGVRVNTGIAYLTDAVRRRPNLTIRGRTEVDRVLIRRGKATGGGGVEGSTDRAGDVILAAGAYGSAAILRRSGGGPAAELRRLDMEVVADLPVGKRLKDHPCYYNIQALKPECAAMAPVAGALLWTASKEAHAGDLDVPVSATHLFAPAQSPTGGAMVLAIARVQPDSVGSVRLRRRDPKGAPRIDLNFLTEDRDRRRLRESVKLSRRIGQDAAFAAVVPREMFPGPTVQDAAALEQAICAQLDAYQHPTATVPMGLEGSEGAVVDTGGAVYGVEHLRVIDAAIRPDIPPAPTNLTTIMVAEHIDKRVLVNSAAVVITR